jgi:hypothetical protein
MISPVSTQESEEDFLKALLVTIGYMALFTLFIFIPLIGFVIAVSLGAYWAGYKGGNYSVDWRKLGIIAAVIWSTIFVMIFLFLVIPLLPFDYDIQIGGWEIAIICIPYASNMLFCVLGARARFKERAVYI